MTAVIAKLDILESIVKLTLMKAVLIPVKMEATCDDDVNEYSGQCAAGYTGTHCETDIDECSSDDCENGGTGYTDTTVPHYRNPL